jgi:acetyltransferase-like isoleucine patch superfamily enzyme
MSNIYRTMLQVFAFVLPWTIRRLVLNMALGFEIEREASIGLSVFNVRSLKMARASRIGHLNYAKGLSEIKLGDSAVIGNLNWITGVPLGDRNFFTDEIGRNPALYIGEHAAITNRHYIDCTNLVVVGPYSTIAGWGTQIVTHGIDMASARQGSRAIEIGSYCFVGTRVILLKGAKLPNYSVLSPGSVLRKEERDTFSLYSGVPASKIRDLSVDNKYFTRKEGICH